jgi:hypothetical protein
MNGIADFLMVFFPLLALVLIVGAVEFVLWVTAHWFFRSRREPRRPGYIDLSVRRHD